MWKGNEINQRLPNLGAQNVLEPQLPESWSLALVPPAFKTGFCDQLGPYIWEKRLVVIMEIEYSYVNNIRVFP